MIFDSHAHYDDGAFNDDRAELLAALPAGGVCGVINAASDLNILENYMNIWAPPGICIVIAVLGFNFVGDGLRDALDPKARR